MTWQNVFIKLNTLRKIRKNSINLSSAELAQRVVKVDRKQNAGTHDNHHEDRCFAPTCKSCSERVITVKGQKLLVFHIFGKHSVKGCAYWCLSKQRGYLIILFIVAFSGLRWSVWNGSGIRFVCSWKSIKLQYCQDSCMHGGFGQLTSVMPKVFGCFGV